MNKHVLLIDDEEEIVSFMQHFLKRLHIPSHSAMSGEEGLSLYDKEKFELVFLDIHMKGLDGLSVLKTLKERNPAVKVIVITGTTATDIRDKAMALGATAYISKPLDLAELKHTVQQYIPQTA